MNYHRAFIFTKRTNLLPWLDSNGHRFGFDVRRNSEQWAALRAEYAVEREVQLILLIRNEGDGICARIKCPVNPLPIKGEFQITSPGKMIQLLNSMGWELVSKQDLHLFK